MASGQSVYQNYTQNLLSAVPRFAQRAGAFAIHYLPDHFDSLIGKLLYPGSIISDPTFTSNLSTPSSTLTSSLVTAMNTSTASAGLVSNPEPQSAMLAMLSLTNIRRLTNFGSYILSKWAFVTMIVAFALNRTQVYASVRVPLRLNFFMRAALYCIPISTLLMQIESLLRALRCQSSPAWSEMRYDNASLQYALDYAGTGGILYTLTSSVLRWESPIESCRAAGMAALDPGEKHYGSLSLLWPLFLSLCGSSFVETLVAALSGRQPIVENSLFEQSMAFAEAEALVMKPFEAAIMANEEIDLTSAALPMKVSQVKRVMNVTQEVLLVALLAALSNLTSNILAIFGKRKKWRLMNTAVWGFAYMGAFAWGLWRVWTNEEPDSWGLKFPTVFVIGFIPHLLIIAGIFCCAAIYSSALILMVISPPPGQESVSIRERFARAYENLQANIYLSTGDNIRFRWEDDFYSSLLKIGFTILTCASEAVYFNESTSVQVSDLTWLERKRIVDITNNQSILFKRIQASVPSEIKRRAATGSATVDRIDIALQSQSGYSVERKPKSRDQNDNAEPVTFENRGTGLVQHHGRWHLVLRFLRGLFWLSAAAALQTLFLSCRLIGVNWRPRWANHLLGTATDNQDKASRSSSQTLSRQFWVVDEDGNKFRATTDPTIDVEKELRKQDRLGLLQPPLSSLDGEADIDTRLYDWWKNGGWFGETDSSGDYHPESSAIPQIVDDEDLTSVISASDAEWLTEVSSSPLSSGQNTPTRNTAHPPFSSSSSSSHSNFTPSDLIDPTHLASLLDPQSTEHLAEARMLARRLRNPNVILTRAQYARLASREHARVLMSSRAFTEGRDRKRLSELDEERALEAFILEVRQRHRHDLPGSGSVAPRRRQGGSNGRAGHYGADNSHNDDDDDSWRQGAPGLGNRGPSCVVCQDAPRTILMWPCGCLALCDECRVIMATRNFTNCVCCRTSTEAFSRLYVP